MKLKLIAKFVLGKGNDETWVRCKAYLFGKDNN